MIVHYTTLEYLPQCFKNPIKSLIFNFRRKKNTICKTFFSLLKTLQTFSTVLILFHNLLYKHSFKGLKSFTKGEKG